MPLTVTVFKASALVVLATLAMALAASPARADYASAKRVFETLSGETQTAITLALIATGDFDGVIDFGFTRRFYKSIVSFERGENLDPDGILNDRELRRLETIANAFYQTLGNAYYTHPVSGAKLLVPRSLFDTEESTAEGIIFSRSDQKLSLSFVAFPLAQKSFGELYATLTAGTADRKVGYKRRFKSHFVATGTFRGRKFYTWINRLPDSSTGFTISWSADWDETGRKISALLANSFLAAPTKG